MYFPAVIDFFLPKPQAGDVKLADCLRIANQLFAIRGRGVDATLKAHKGGLSRQTCRTNRPIQLKVSVQASIASVHFHRQKQRAFAKCTWQFSKDPTETASLTLTGFAIRKIRGIFWVTSSDMFPRARLALEGLPTPYVL